MLTLHEHKLSAFFIPQFSVQTYSTVTECFRLQNKMNKKVIISQSIMWAAAILVVSIVEEKEFAVLMLVILATTSLITLRKGNE